MVARYYIPSNGQANTATRMSATNTVTFGAVSPAVQKALGATTLPAVVIESPPGIYPAVIADDGTLTSGQVDTVAAPYVTAESNAATQATNQQTIVANIASALAQLRTIQTQATTFQGQAAYATANLANLNDLLSKCQTIAGAVGNVATDLIWLARYLSNQFDGTT